VVFVIYAVEISSGGVIPLPSFMKSGTGIQAIIRFYHSNLNGCIVGITEGRDEWLRWHDKHANFDENWWRQSSNIKDLPQQLEKL
jgi:hypothetical protein